MDVKILQAGVFLKHNSYQINRLLGQGGFGAVYLADDMILEKPCAIKESFDNSPGAQAQFEVEARILANLNHPHLPRVTDNFVEPASGLQYLVMEYVQGQNLAEILERSGPPAEAQVRTWADQVLDALAYLHTHQPRSIIHRDVKPDNIRLLDDGKTVKLVDFGIAKLGGAGEQTRKGARGATPGYSPPEQYGSGGTGPYSDVYALGATLYHLLTNILPPDAIDRAYSGAQLLPPRQLNPTISEALEQIILTAMQLQPSLRFPDAAEMRAALQNKRPTVILVSCPHCGSIVRPEAKFCPSCGKPITTIKPLVFQKSGFQATNLQELVRGCDTYWEEASQSFQRGEIDSWLSSLGSDGEKLAHQAQSLRAHHSDSSAALEAFLSKAAPTRSYPILTIQPENLDAGILTFDEGKNLTLQITNSGRGYLHGTLQAQPSWIQLNTTGFGCLSGVNQTVEVQILTRELSGSDLGVDYNGSITVLSNRGQLVIPVKMRLVDEPRPHLEPNQVDLGALPWGTKTNCLIQVSNRGGSILRGELVSTESWLMPDPRNRNFSLSKYQSLPVNLAVDTTSLEHQGIYSARLLVQTQKHSSITATVTLTLKGGFALDITRLDSIIDDKPGLIQFCDQNWPVALGWLKNGRITAFLRFIGEDKLEQLAIQAIQQSDVNAGLETILRACGAKPAKNYHANIREVLHSLGFGLSLKLGKKTDSTLLAIQNTSQRGYLYGSISPLAPWLVLNTNEFGCLPGETACLDLKVDHQIKKATKLALRTALFEIDFR